MRFAILELVSFLGLGATILPALIYFARLIDLNAVQWSAFIGTVLWFVATPIWMGRDRAVQAQRN